MASREEKVTAGFFVLVGLVLIMVTVALIAGVRLRRSENVYYVNFTESVYGLDAQSTVTYQGVPAGRVKAIEFTEDVSTIRVVLGLDPKLRVKVTTHATLKQHFITNKTIIELVGGKNEDRNLPPESFIKWQETGLMVVQRSVPEMLDKISDSLDAVRKVLSEENVARFSHIMENLDKALAEGRGQVDRLTHASEELLAEARKAVADLSELATTTRGSITSVESDVKATLGTARQFLTRTQEEVDPALRQATAAIDQVAKMSAELNDFARRAGALLDPTSAAVGKTAALLERADDLITDNRVEIADALQSIRRAARATEMLLLQLERNPGLLLGSPREDTREIPGH